jgi:hypothetical protein
MPTPSNTIKLADLAQANALLVSMGGEDQMPRIAAASVERSIQLQSRIERALAYAAETPPNSAHARQMARILDGSITIDDEQNEVPEDGRPEPRRLPASSVNHRAVERSPKSKGKLKPGNGLTGRSTKQRLEIREWIAHQGIEIAPSGRIPQEHIDAYDRFKELERKARIEERKQQAESSESFPGL